MKLKKVALPINMSTMASLKTPDLEATGETCILDSDMTRNPLKTIDLNRTMGECILYPNTLYFASLKLDIATEEVQHMKEFVANSDLPLMGLDINLSVKANNDPTQPALFVVVLTTVMKMKINFNQIALADIIFEYDEENVPKFLQNLLPTEIEEVSETPYVPEATEADVVADSVILNQFEQETEAQRTIAAEQVAAQQAAAANSSGNIMDHYTEV